MKRLALLLGLALLAACEREPPPATPLPAPEPEQALPALDTPLNTRELWLSGADYWEAAAAAAAELNTAIAQLLARPDGDSLTAARRAWHRAHAATAACTPLARLASGHPDLFAKLAGAWFQIDTRPIAPGYVDAIEGYPDSGVVHDTTLTINHTSLREQHGLSSEYEAILGLHVLEFLLWGETGERPPGDFARAEASTTLRSVDQPRNRRRDLLELVGRLLEDDLRQLATQWRDPESPIAAPYFRLPDASRALLWRQALAASLADPENHCEFAPEGCPPTAEIVATLLDLAGGHPTLIIAEHWQQRLENLAQHLADGEQDAAMEQLAELRELLERR